MPGVAMEPTLAEEHPIVKDELYELEDVSGNDDASDAYKPRPQLGQPAVLMRSLAYLVKGLEDKIIDVDPDYQREVVWTADRMTGLVNSLMENYYIPPIILNKKTLGSLDGKPGHSMVCVDGKQRLSSVLAFVKGMIPCHDYRGEKWWFCNTSNRPRKVLSEAAQRQFLSKEFVSFEFKDLSPDQEEDLFARVQMGLQLSAAEKMRATTGPWQELAKAFVGDFADVFSLLKDCSRAKDFQMALGCFSQILEVQHPNASTGIPALKSKINNIQKFVENKQALDDGTRSHLAAVFRKFNDLINLDADVFRNVERKLKGVQTFAPIEMVAIAVLISMYSDERNDRLLIGDIKYLRNLIRETFIDLRMNDSVWKFIWEYIDDLEHHRGAVDNTTIAPKGSRRALNESRTEPKKSRPAATTLRSGQPVPTSPQASAPQANAAKRASDTTEASEQRKKARNAARPKKAVVAPPKRVVVKTEPAESGPGLPPFPFTEPSPARDPTSSGNLVPSGNYGVSETGHRHSDQLSLPSASGFGGTSSRNRLTATPVHPTQHFGTQAQSYGHGLHSAPITGLPATPAIDSPTVGASGSYAPPAPMMLPYHRSSPQKQSLPIHKKAAQQKEHVSEAPLLQPLSRQSSSTISQYDGTIDLTSDTELERQDLLSSFRSHATNERATSQVRAQQHKQQPRQQRGFPNDRRRPVAFD